MAPLYPPSARYGKLFQNPNPPSLFTSTMKTLLAPAFAALPATPVFGPDSNSKIAAEVRWTLAAAQVTASHEDDQDAVKTQTLKSAIVLAPYRDKVDLSGATRASGSVYEHASGTNHRHLHLQHSRRLALAALQAFGTGHAQDFVASNTTPEQNDEGRLVVVSALNGYSVTHTASAKVASELQHITAHRTKPRPTGLRHLWEAHHWDKALVLSAGRRSDLKTLSHRPRHVENCAR